MRAQLSICGCSCRDGLTSLSPRSIWTSAKAGPGEFCVPIRGTAVQGWLWVSGALSEHRPPALFFFPPVHHGDVAGEPTGRTKIGSNSEQQQKRRRQEHMPVADRLPSPRHHGEKPISSNPSPSARRLRRSGNRCAQANGSRWIWQSPKPPPSAIEQGISTATRLGRPPSRGFVRALRTDASSWHQLSSAHFYLFMRSRPLIYSRPSRCFS